MGDGQVAATLAPYCALFAAQSDHWINAGRAVSGDITGQECNNGQQGS